MTDILGNIAAFVFALGIIIFVHEGGHYLVAKLFGMRVLTFSLGFGKRVWGFTRGETDYRLSAIPLGGYVKLSGEELGETGEDPRDFGNRPRWQRVLVYLAGPAMNAVLAILVVAGLFMVGVEVPALQKIPPVVGSVEAGGAGAAAGFAVGDRVLAIDGREVDRWQEVVFAVMTSIGRPLPVAVERDGARLELTLTPRKLPDYDLGDAGLFPRLLPHIASIEAGSPASGAGFALGDELRGVDGRRIANSGDFIEYVTGKAGQEIRIEVLRRGEVVVLPVVPAERDGRGRIGVGLAFTQRFGPLQAVSESVRFNLEIARQSLVVVGKIFTREVKAKSALAGPIEIAAQSGAAARSGVKTLLYLVAVISVSIGLLNLFPIPLLDGGQIVLLLLESTIRRDLPVIVKERINQVGLALIVLLMVTVFYFDISKNLPDVLRPGS